MDKVLAGSTRQIVDMKLLEYPKNWCINYELFNIAEANEIVKFNVFPG